ncbi:hypothetical protein C5167_023552 [Papaver somniferum]|uniref:C2 domain-containing protein n=1 Tax=Papaver somniferum TaxID=3469 RepID=A0A4Y7JL51_PAPSO|nr:hypothetical protein C5167_023552 [Papaver somniferum]
MILRSSSPFNFPTKVGTGIGIDSKLFLGILLSHSNQHQHHRKRRRRRLECIGCCMLPPNTGGGNPNFDSDRQSVVKSLGFSDELDDEYREIEAENSIQVPSNFTSFQQDPLVAKLRTQLGVIHPIPSPPPINRNIAGLFVFFFLVGVVFDKVWTSRKKIELKREKPATWPQVPTSFSLFLEKDLQRKESVEWVNMVLGKLWKVYRVGLENWLIGLLQPVIDNLKKPDYVERVEIKQFSLGEEPLSVRNVERRTSRRANDLQFLTKLLTEDLPRLFVRPRKSVLDFQKITAVGPISNDIIQDSKKDFVGELSVTLVDARKLPYFFSGKTDPFVVLSLGDQVMRSKKNSQTTVIGRPGEPIWNQDFDMLVANPRKQKLQIQVKDSLGFTDLTVGTGEVELGSLQDTVPTDKIVALKGGWDLFRKGSAGEILLRLTYKAYVEDEEDDRTKEESVDPDVSDDEMLDSDEADTTPELPQGTSDATEKESFMDVLAALIVSEEFLGIVASETGNSKTTEDVTKSASSRAQTPDRLADSVPPGLGTGVVSPEGNLGCIYCSTRCPLTASYLVNPSHFCTVYTFLGNWNGRIDDPRADLFEVAIRSKLLIPTDISLSDYLHVSPANSFEDELGRNLLSK